MKKILLILIVGLATMSCHAEGWWSDVKVNSRLGFSLGGTMPLGMPSNIRSLEKYDLRFNPMIGLDLEKPINDRWGIMTGLRLERKSMEIEAKVKNYHIAIVRGGESLEGMFTGYNHTKECQWELTLPVCATYNIHKVRIFLGPYIAYVTDREFEGYAFDGYLRVGDPTGPKVELGSSETERGSYDFASDMRRMQWGIQAGADWRLSQNIGVYGMVEWGLCGIYKSTFHVIEQTLYPIYGTIGVNYYF